MEMQIIKRIKKLQEAAKRQGIVVTDILDDGTVVSDLPAYTRTYRLRESEECPYCNGEGCEKCMKLEVEDEEVKTKHADKADAATDIVDSIIKGDFEAAHEALDDFIKLYVSDKAEEDEKESEESEAEENSAEEDAENNADASGIDSDALMPVEDEEDEAKEWTRRRISNLTKESVNFDVSKLSDDELLDKFTEIEKAMKSGDPHNVDGVRAAHRKVTKELKRRGFSFSKR